MRKFTIKLLMALLLVFPSMVVLSQTCEDFDDLNVGGYVAEQLGGNWTTWSGTPGTAEDALVSDLYSISPSNSILVEGTTDLVQLITGANIISGKWSYSLNIYVPNGTTGYFNLQKDVVPGTEWGFQVMFEDDMTMVVDGGAAGAAIIPYLYDTWYLCELIVDIDSDWCEFYVDGTLELGYQWTLGTFGTAGANTLAGSNIYANPGASGTPPGAHFDDICFMEILPPVGNCEDFDDLTVGGYVAEQLGGMWTTWSGAPGGSEDAFVSDDQSVSPNNSFVVNDGGIDLVLELAAEPIETGEYLYSHSIYVPSGFSGYFNIQSEPAAGVDWVIELYFDDGGTGSFAGGSTETFVYDQDTWILVEIYFDLDSDLAEVYFDGVLILEFDNALTIGGVDYWGAISGGPPGAYFDDVCFEEILGPGDCEGFDELTVGGYVAEQLGGMWTTWSGAPGGSEDAFVSDDFSVSPDNSFIVNDGGIDLVLELADEPIETGAWLYSNYIYVPTGFSGYFNVQSEPAAGVDWVIELYFDDGGTGSFAGGSTETFEYTQDTWIMVEINFDLDSDLAQVFFDGNMIVQFANALTIGGIDYYGSTSGGTPGAYYDEVCFGEGWPLTVGIEDVVVTNSTQVYPNPATDVVYIKSDFEISSIRVFNYAGQLVAEEMANNNMFSFNTSQFGAGLYFFQIETSEGIITKRIVVQ
nr:T9SS type A sorting domain-containing protein [Bacteroidota bacterium]